MGAVEGSEGQSSAPIAKKGAISSLTKESELLVLALQKLLGGVTRVVENMGQLAELIRLVDDLPDGLVLIAGIVRGVEPLVEGILSRGKAEELGDFVGSAMCPAQSGRLEGVTESHLVVVGGIVEDELRGRVDSGGSLEEDTSGDQGGKLHVWQVRVVPMDRGEAYV